MLSFSYILTTIIQFDLINSIPIKENPIPKEMLPMIPPQTGVIIPEIRGMIKNPNITNTGPKRFSFQAIRRDTVNKIHPIENVANAIIAPAT